VLFRKALRRLLAAPLFTVFAVVSVAAGIAITTAVYSVVDTLLLEQTDVADAATLGIVVAPASGDIRRTTLSASEAENLRAARSFAAVSATVIGAAPVTSTRHAEMIGIEAVDARYFGVVGAGIPLGRGITDADDGAAAAVVVISDKLWRSHYASDPGAVGRTLRIGERVFGIIGVARPGFAGIGGRGPFGANAWIPLSQASVLGPGDERRRAAERRDLTVVGRLKAGVSMAAASAEVQTIGGQLDRSQPRLAGATIVVARGWQVRSVADLDDEDSGARRTGLLLVAFAAMVLVVACTNLSNLVLARGSARQGELAVRMAMGASRARLVWEQCVESILLSCVGGAAAYALFVALSAWMTRDFSITVPPVGRFMIAIHPTLNPESVVVAAVAMLLSLLVFSLEPAVHLARTLDIRSALAAQASGVRPRTRRQRMILRWQVAVAAGFFIVATMFIRVTVEQARHDSGVDIDQIVVASVLLNDGGSDDGQLRRRIEVESAKESALVSVAVSTGLPFGVPSTLQASIARAGGDRAAAKTPVVAIAATPSIFRTLGIPIARGRALREADDGSAAPVVVVSELAAVELLKRPDPVGEQVVIRAGQSERIATVIGVSRDTDVSAMNGRRRPLVFVPVAQQDDIAPLTVTARGSGRTSSAVAALRAAIERADPAVSIDIIGGGREVLSGGFEILRSAGRGALYLGGATRLRSMFGLFGVPSHVVTFRTREFGVRMSLGATARQIKMLVIRDGARAMFEGLVLGLWGGVAGRLMVRSYLDLDVAALDAWMLLITLIPIVLAALCACYLPASRASRVDPMTALRHE
jgi:predicted permease